MLVSGRNKKGQFFSLYLVFITLFMCGLGITIYFYQQGQVSNSILSPVSLLELEDSLEVFEMQEKNLILLAAKDSLIAVGESKWNSDDFINEFEKRFFSLLQEDEQAEWRGFLFSDLVLDEQELELGVFNSVDSRGNFYRRIYDFDFVLGNFIVMRGDVEKHFSLQVEERTKINFPVEVEYVYSNEYSISLNDVKGVV